MVALPSGPDVAACREGHGALHGGLVCHEDLGCGHWAHLGRHVVVEHGETLKIKIHFANCNKEFCMFAFGKSKLSEKILITLKCIGNSKV